MKKITRLLLLICLLSLSLLALCSCGDKLPSPQNLTLDVDTQTLTWDKVKGASYYTVKVSDDSPEITTLTASISLEHLDPGVYYITVRANGDGDKTFDSKWSDFTFQRLSESGLKYQLVNNGREYQLIGAGNAVGDVVMESIYRGKPVTSIAPKALYNNVKITSFTVGENVKTIGDKAFTKCAKLETVIIPGNSVTSIGEYAFQSCKLLKNVVLPDSVTEIKAHSFAWCSALTDVTVGNRLAYIDEYAFSNCSSLTKLTYSGFVGSEYESNLPGTLKNIAQYAFTDCTSLKTIDLGDGLEYVGNGAFMSCTALVDIDFGASLNKIDECAFQYCTSLASVIIPDSAEYLASAAFFGCTALTEVNLGKGLKDVGFSVFSGTPIVGTGLETLIIDGWLINLVTKDLIYTVPEGVYGIASYASSENTVIQQLNLPGVKYVSEAAFYACTSVFKVTFDDALISLGEAAFYGCKMINSVNLGNSLEHIDSYVFYDCEKLGTKEDAPVLIPDTVRSIGTQAFRNTAVYYAVASVSKGGVIYIDVTTPTEDGVAVTAKWAVDFIPPAKIDTPTVIADTTVGIANYAFSYQSSVMVYIADSVKYIGRGAFYKSSIVAIDLPESLLHIGDYAFYDCYITNFGTDRYDLVIPDGTLTIGRSAFYGCESILSLVIPGSVQSIGDFAFYECVNIGATFDLEVSTGETDEDGLAIKEVMPVTGFITLNEGIASIGDRAFQGCISIIDLKLPDSITSIGLRAFYNCSALKSVSIGNGVTSINDYMFNKCDSLETVILSDNITSIGKYAFRGCVALKNIEMKSVETIGDYAFYGCNSLSAIVLPNSLTTLGNYVFRGCNSLKSIIIPENVSSIGKHTFYGLNSMTIYSTVDSSEKWDSRYNSSFRPVFWGCEVSEDGGYVVSVVAGVIENAQAIGGIADPVREGYVFAGWTTVSGGTTAEYTSANVADAPEGVTLYAVWNAVS